eukprot:Skav201146  [mRNA]  locus=scaffold2068:98333:104766:+ [translate_table: standard]
MAMINEMLAAIPLDLSDNAVKQRERKLSIDRLRIAIAQRWHQALQLRAVLPPDDWQRLKGEVSACMTTLLERNDDEIPFAPDMVDIAPDPQAELTPVAFVDPVIAGDDLAWQQRGEWLDVPSYVAHHRICALPCSLLTKMLSVMKVRGYSKLTHRLKAELFLKHLGWTDDQIETALADLKVRTRKSKQQGEGEEAQDAAEDDKAESTGL